MALQDLIDAAGLDASLSTILVLSSDVTIRALIIQNGPFHGIQVGSGHANAGIITNHTASMTIANNTIENNGVGTGFNLVDIVLYPHGQTSILNNTITNNNIVGIFAR